MCLNLEYYTGFTTLLQLELLLNKIESLMEKIQKFILNKTIQKHSVKK